MSDTLIGKKLGDYVIQEILGRGGMAHVYRGYDPNLQRFAAVKVIDSRLLSKGHEEEYRARFRREARAIARLTHPNIVGVYQFGEFGPLYYMAMEFIDGRDLGVTLKQNAQIGIRLTPRQMVRIIHDIAGALDYAHSGNVIHRDVKPSNIMVTSDERAVLTDFGLALDVPEGTGGNTFGSAHYIAPEQAISSRNAVPQSDLYSLGVVLYQMATGRVPFDDNSAMSVALKHLSDAPPPPRMVDPNVSVAVEKVILRALEKEPSRRYKNGETLARALEEALETTIDDLTDMPTNGSRPSRMSLSATNPKRSTREMETISTETIQFADQDVSIARAAILKAKERPNNQRVLIAIGLTIIALLLLGIFAIIRMDNDNGSPTTPTVVVAAVASASVEGGGAQSTATASNTPDATNTSEVVADAATDEVTDSPDASALVTETVTAAETETDTPAETDVIEPTATSAATDTDASPEVTPSRTASPTRRATRTPSPTDTPTPVDTATRSSESFSGGAIVNGSAPLMLIYDDDQLVLLNRSEESMNISGLVFMQRTPGGVVSFEATSWETDLLTSLPAGDCLMLWRIGTREAPTPTYCHERQAWFAVGTPRRFWLNPDTSATFDVFNFGLVVATCPVNSGDCGLET